MKNFRKLDALRQVLEMIDTVPLHLQFTSNGHNSFANQYRRITGSGVHGDGDTAAVIEDLEKAARQRIAESLRRRIEAIRQDAVAELAEQIGMAQSVGKVVPE